jgi:hypothetical protein
MCEPHYSHILAYLIFRMKMTSMRFEFEAFTFERLTKRLLDNTHYVSPPNYYLNSSSIQYFLNLSFLLSIRNAFMYSSDAKF